MSESNHPDFDAAPANHRWSRPLKELKAALRAAAFRARGKVVWYILPHGAIVSMRVDENAFPHRELRIARSDAPTDDAGRAAWQREIAVFCQYLQAEQWHIEREGVTPAGGIEVVLRETLTLAAQPEGPRCEQCGNPATGGPYKRQLCVQCAIKAGNEEIAAKGNAR